AAFYFGDLRSAPLDGEHNVVAFVEFLDGIGKPAPADSIDLGDRRPLTCGDVTQLSDEGIDIALLDVGSDDKQHFIDSHQRVSSFWVTGRRRRAVRYRDARRHC